MRHARIYHLEGRTCSGRPYTAVVHRPSCIGRRARFVVAVAARALPGRRAVHRESQKSLDISMTSPAASSALPASPCSGACSVVYFGRSKRAAQSGSGFVPAGPVHGNRTVTLLGPVRSGPPTAGPKDGSVRDRTGPDRVHLDMPP